MEFTDENFIKEIEENKNLVLVDFSAPWCGPCKMMAPIIEELIQDYKDKEIKIGKLNIDENQQIAEKYNIVGVPTFILFKEGKAIKQMTGFRSKRDLEELINKNINK